MSPAPAFHWNNALPDPEFLWNMSALYESPVSVEPTVQVLFDVDPDTTVPERLFAVRVSK